MNSPLIAIVDDDQSVLEALEGLLVSAGYQVLPYTSAEALLSANRHRDITCLISDIGLPGMNGIELLRQLRSLRPDLAAIVITARHEQALLQAASDAGARHVLLKPLDSDELLRAIAAFC